MKTLIAFAIMTSLLSLAGCATTQSDMAKPEYEQSSGRSAEQPGLAKAYSDRGLVKLIVHDDYAGAIDDFAMAIGYKPSDASLYVCRGLAYLKKGNNDAAKTDFDKAASLEPGLSETLKSQLESSR